MKKKLTGVLIGTLVLVEASLAAPVVVFEDNFNDEPLPNGPLAAINVTPEAWICGGGSVDIIGEGTEWDFPVGQGHGLYLDLDGGIGPEPDGLAGILAIRDPILFRTGCTYTLTFDLAGSQQPGQPDEIVAIGFVDQGPLFDATFTRKWDAGFSTEPYVFPGDGRFRQLVFHNSQSYDNFGALLDNVVLTEECDDPCRIPAPGAVLLGSLGAALVGLFRRRRL